MHQWAENDSHQIRRYTVVGTNARISAPRNTSRRLNINTYTIYDRENLSRSFESVPNVGNRSTFDGTMRFSGAKSGHLTHLQGWTRNQWYPMKWQFWARIFMDFPFQPQLVTTLAPSSRRVWECWDMFACFQREISRFRGVLYREGRGTRPKKISQSWVFCILDDFGNPAMCPSLPPAPRVPF